MGDDAIAVGRPDRLPESLRALFWDCDFDALSWAEHGDGILLRVLSEGSWSAIQDVRAKVAYDGIRAWILARRGRGLSRAQLRFWQNVLDLPPAAVDEWLADPARATWDRRTTR